VCLVIGPLLASGSFPHQHRAKLARFHYLRSGFFGHASPLLGFPQDFTTKKKLYKPMHLRTALVHPPCCTESFPQMGGFSVQGVGLQPITPLELARFFRVSGGQRKPRRNFHRERDVSPIFMGSPFQSQPRTSMPGAAYRAPLLNGEPGTAQTIALMRKLVDEALSDASFIRQATDIVRSVRAFDEIGEAQALYNWVHRYIRFTKDPLTKEKLYPPQELLKIRAGDCDDIAMLLGAFLLAVGYPARLVTVSANPDSPQEFSHVYVEGEVPAGSGNWIPMDVARIDSQFGTEPPVYFRKKAWSLVDDTSQDLNGGRLRGSLSGYIGMGDGAIDYNTLLQQGLTEIPAIISTAGGGSSSFATPQGTAQTAPPNPYASFMTPYTPGYGVPGGGYGGSISVASSFPWGWVLGAGLIALLVSRRRR